MKMGDLIRANADNGDTTVLLSGNRPSGLYADSRVRRKQLHDIDVELYM